MNDDSDDRYAGIDIDCLLNRSGNRRGLAYSRKKALYEAPEFLQRLNGEETLMEGQSLCLECKVRGFPVPVLRWYKDDEEIYNHPRIRIETNGHGGYALIIDNVTRGDEAAYRCRAENVEGACSSVFFLSVRAKPKSNKSNNNRGSNRRTVSFPPMFSTIVEKVEEEEKQGKEFEQLPPSPLTDFYYALNLKGRATWPAFLGEWAFKTGGRRGSDADTGGDDGDEPMSPSEGRAKARLRRSDLTARVEAKKQRLDEERKRKEAEEKEEADRKKREKEDEAARKRREEEEEARKLETKIIMEREERRRKRAALEEESEKKEEAMRKRREARAARLEKERQEREEEDQRVLKEQEEEKEKKRRLEIEAREEKERIEREEEEERQKKVKEEERQKKEKEEERQKKEKEETKRREEQKRLEEQKKNEELRREAEEKRRKQEELERKEAELRRVEEQLKKENEEKKKKAKKEQEAQRQLEERKKKEEDAKKKKPENTKLKERFENLARKEDILNNNESGSLKKGPKALQMFQEKAETKPNPEPAQKKPSQNNVLNRFKEKLPEPGEASKDAAGNKPGVLPKQGQVNKLKPVQTVRDRSPTPAVSSNDKDVVARDKSPLKTPARSVGLDDKTKSNANSTQKLHKDNQDSKIELKQNKIKPVEDGKTKPGTAHQEQPPPEPKWKMEMRLREEAKRKQEENKKAIESKEKGGKTEANWKQTLKRKEEKDPKEEKMGTGVTADQSKDLNSKTAIQEKQMNLAKTEEEKRKREAEQKEKEKQEELRKKELAQKELLQKKKENEERQAKKEKEEQEKRRIELRKEQMIKEQLKRQEEEMKRRQEKEMKKRQEEEMKRWQQKQREQAEKQEADNDEGEFEVKVYKRDYSFSDLRKSLETSLKGGGGDIIGEEEHKYWDDILTKHNYSVGDIKKTLGNLASGSATLDRPSRMRSRRNSVEELEIVKMKRSSSISDLRESFTKSLERPKSKKKASDPEKAKKHEELLKRTTNVGETRQQLLESAKKLMEPLTYGMSSKEADITIRNLKVKDVQSELSVPRVSPSRLHSASPEPPTGLKSASVDVKSKRTSFHELISLQQSDSTVVARSGTSVTKKDVSKRISYHGQFDAYGSRTIPAYKRVAGWADDIGQSREEETRSQNAATSDAKLSTRGAEGKRLNLPGSVGKKSGSPQRDGSLSPDSLQQDTGVRPFVFNSTRTIARKFKAFN